jgi:hypothetical protein
MPRGGRTSGTWKKGQNPIKRKGQIHKKTKLKNSIGLQNWEGLKEFIEKDGATKLIEEIKKLTGRNYVNAMAALTEFVKPKLSRVDANVKANINISELPINFE